MIRRLMLWGLNRSGSYVAAYTASCVCIVIGIATLPTDDRGVAAPLILMGVGLLAILRRMMTIASTAVIAVMTMMAAAAMSMNSHPYPLTGGHTLVSTLAYTVASVGSLIWIVGNGPLRPVRRACGLVTIISGGAGLGMSTIYWAVPSVAWSMPLHIGVGIIALGVAVHEVEMRTDGHR